MTDDLTATRGDTREAPDERHGMSENEAAAVRESVGALCVICQHRVAWHHDERGCEFHGGGSRRCPCRRTSDQVVARIVYEALMAAAGKWLNASVRFEPTPFPGQTTATPTPPPTGPLVEPVAVAEAGVGPMGDLTCRVCGLSVSLVEAPSHAEEHAQQGEVPFQCGPRCDHGDAPHLYLNAIDSDRCAACAAWPAIPCAQHRTSA